MNAQRVNYDEIAPTYNRRYFLDRPGGTHAALESLARSTGARKILEAGCGTAHWLEALRARMSEECQLYGLDLSTGMLAQARRLSESLHLAQAKAECLPIKNSDLDLVFCVNAIHHFDDPRAFIHDAARVLRPGGALGIIGTQPRGRYGDWYIYEYFPGTYESDLKRFPSWGAIADWTIEAGFEHFDWRLAEHIHDPKYGTDVLADPYLEKNAVSQLALLSDHEYNAGIERIKKALLRAEKEKLELVFRCDIDLHILAATRQIYGKES